MQILSPIPDLLNQKFWEWDCKTLKHVLTSSPGEPLTQFLIKTFTSHLHHGKRLQKANIPSKVPAGWSDHITLQLKLLEMAPQLSKASAHPQDLQHLDPATTSSYLPQHHYLTQGGLSLDLPHTSLYLVVLAPLFLWLE